MTFWYDPTKDLKEQLTTLDRRGDLYNNVTDYQARLPDSLSCYARITDMHSDNGLTRNIPLENLPGVARLLNRIGWGLSADRYTSALYPKRRNPLLNEQVMNNRAEIKKRWLRARKELEVTGSIWESVRGIKAMHLDKRMVRGVVDMARRWPEVMCIGYDGDTVESFDGPMVAPEDTILVRFWPVCFQQKLGTTGLTGVAIFNIGPSGDTRWINLGDGQIHPHFFSNGTICAGSAEHDFDSQIHSLATLREWWVGTDHAPAYGQWSQVAEDWWEYKWSQFFAFFEGGDPAVYTEERIETFRDDHGWLRNRVAYTERNVTDDGLDIPGLSLPEYTPHRGGPFYIVAPEQSEGRRIDAEDVAAESALLPLTKTVLATLIEEYNVGGRAPRSRCYNCGQGLGEYNSYFCDYCDEYYCRDHWNFDSGMCDNCHSERYSDCDKCGTEIYVDDIVRCYECEDTLCANCRVNVDGIYYCTRHEPDEDDDDDDDDVTEDTDRTPLPGQPALVVGYRCGLHGNIRCRICAVAVVGLRREEFIPETNRGRYHCEAPGRANGDTCLERATWRRRPFDTPGWLCEDHYHGIPETVTPVHYPGAANGVTVPARPPVVQEPTRYPVAPGWVPVRGGRTANIICCHPECVPLATEANYQGDMDNHIWPPVREYFGEYACEAHVPRQLPEGDTTAIPGWTWYDTGNGTGNAVRNETPDDYEFVGTGDQWECEWPSHEVYLGLTQANETLRELRCRSYATWRHHFGDFGDAGDHGEYDQPHYLCDAHHAAVLQGGYHDAVNNAAVAPEVNPND